MHALHSAGADECRTSSLAGGLSSVGRLGAPADASLWPATVARGPRFIDDTIALVLLGQLRQPHPSRRHGQHTEFVSRFRRGRRLRASRTAGRRGVYGRQIWPSRSPVKALGPLASALPKRNPVAPVQPPVPPVMRWVSLTRPRT